MLLGPEKKYSGVSYLIVFKKELAEMLVAA
jgi:hypothetical protein